MNGDVALRDRGAIWRTWLCDTLGDSQRGGDVLEETVDRVSGPHPLLEQDEDAVCESVHDLIGGEGNPSHGSGPGTGRPATPPQLEFARCCSNADATRGPRDPDCKGVRVPAGEGFVDDDHRHRVRNENGAPAKDISVIMGPPMGPFRSDLDRALSGCGS